MNMTIISSIVKETLTFSAMKLKTTQCSTQVLVIHVTNKSVRQLFLITITSTIITPIFTHLKQNLTSLIQSVDTMHTPQITTYINTLSMQELLIMEMT